ncbi:MAG: hypothetical protein WCO10_02425 [bacterium]
MKKILETAKELAKSNKVKVSVYVIAGVLVLLFVFQAGMFVGFKKASFSFRVGENYFREMNGRRNDPMMGLRRDDFGNSHGAIGQIVGVKLPTISLEEPNGSVKNILVSTSTAVRGFQGQLKIEDLKVGDYYIVFGSANDQGLVEAKLLRLMPAPENMPGTPIRN